MQANHLSSIMMSRRFGKCLIGFWQHLSVKTLLEASLGTSDAFKETQMSQHMGGLNLGWRMFYLIEAQISVQVNKEKRHCCVCIFKHVR